MLLDEIANILELDGTTKNTYSALILSGRGLHIQGKIKIINCTSVKIDFLLMSQMYTILGENLKIKNLTQSSMSIKGKIYAYYLASKISPKLEKE